MYEFVYLPLSLEKARRGFDYCIVLIFTQSPATVCLGWKGKWEWTKAWWQMKKKFWTLTERRKVPNVHTWKEVKARKWTFSTLTLFFLLYRSTPLITLSLKELGLITFFFSSSLCINLNQTEVTNNHMDWVCWTPLKYSSLYMLYSLFDF